MESRAYREMAAEKGVSLDDSDDEWPELTKDDEENATSTST